MGNSSSGFAFEIGDVCQAYQRIPSTYWQLHEGKRKVGGEAVSIFRLDKQSTPRLKLEAGLHGLQKMKTVRHPYILQFIDGADLEKELVLVTEPVQPLLQWLSLLDANKDISKDQVAWGLRCIASALDFLNANHHMTHGMVSNFSIFVTRAGDWKLGGLDLLCEWKADGKDIFHFQIHESIVPPEYRAPERRRNSIDEMLRGPPGAMDVWALGALLDDILGGRPTGGVMANIQRRLMLESPSERPSAGQLLRHSYFQNKELIKVLTFLENFSLKDDAEKVRFFQEVHQQISHFPPEIGIYKILPTFRDYVHIHSGQTSTGGQPMQRHLVLAALPVCLEILKSLDMDTFAAVGESTVVSLFNLNDRALRASLLQNLQHFSEKLSEDNINGKIFDSILTGFSDSAPQLRELTLKSMLCLSPHLSEKNLNDLLMRSLTKLHVDPEPSIRTNTTIFLGRIAPQLKEGSRSRVLLPAFLKACRDPFPHARLAGLKAATASTQYFDVIDISTKIMPMICLLLTDQDSSVRDAAFQCHDAFFKILIGNAQRMKEAEEKRRSQEMDKGVPTPPSANINGDRNVVGSAGAALGTLAQATSSVAAWGAQKVWASTTSTIGLEQLVMGDGETGEGVLDTATRKPSQALASGGAGDEDDVFFDVIDSGPPLHAGSCNRARSISSSFSKSPASGGWEDKNDWEDIDALPLKKTPVAPSRIGIQTHSSSSSLSSSSPSSPSANLRMDGLNLSSSASRTRLQQAGGGKGGDIISSDDLFSILNDGAETKKTTSSTTTTTISSSTQSSTRLAVSPISTSTSSTAVPAKKLVKGTSRLQAKKLSVEKSDWDDF